MLSHFNGCKNLSTFFIDKNIKKFIQIGSSIEYGKLKSPQRENKKNLQKTYNGLGISILSTPRGVMSDNEAREANVGGEVLCTIY